MELNPFAGAGFWTPEIISRNIHLAQLYLNQVEAFWTAQLFDNGMFSAEFWNW